MENIQDIICAIRRTVERHKLADGRYCRWLWQDGKGSRELGLNPYGCADAANILYSIGAFPKSPSERSEWVNTLQSMQSPETGLFHERTHYPIHTTAHCAAALELFDAKPLYPMSALEQYLEPGKLEAFLDELGWYDNPWTQSHNGAVYFGAIGGCGALLSKCIKKAEVIAYEDLGAEALRRLEVEDFPVTVIIDALGNDLYETGRRAYLEQCNGKQLY